VSFSVFSFLLLRLTYGPSSISAVKAATKSERGQTPAQELRSLRSDHKAPETRAREIQQTVEGILTKQKEEDSQWENVLDVSAIG